MATKEDTTISATSAGSTGSLEPEETAPKVKIPRWRRWVGYIWDSYGAEPTERKYIQKVDLYLLYRFILSV
jgi:hypothetical protein